MDRTSLIKLHKPAEVEAGYIPSLYFLGESRLPSTNLEESLLETTAFANPLLNNRDGSGVGEGGQVYHQNQTLSSLLYYLEVFVEGTRNWKGGHLMNLPSNKETRVVMLSKEDVDILIDCIDVKFDMYQDGIDSFYDPLDEEEKEQEQQLKDSQSKLVMLRDKVRSLAED
jgi:hypothetical protein